MATTASYQASFSGFEQAGYGRADAEELMRRSVQLADAARQTFWSKHQDWLQAGSASDQLSFADTSFVGLAGALLAC